jgi:response regulator RpfG family c-di-GMP phosphodiesterase
MLCVLVAKRMNLTAQQVRDLEMAAELRDIGLCAIPYGLVNKKSTYHWDEADWATYYRHAEVSGAMLELVPSLRHLAPIVRWHHTDFFGPEVFPSGHDIPIESRILKVVSEYVWLTKLQGSLLAKDALKRERGRAFDPAVVDNLLQVLTSTSVESSRTTVQV